MRPPKTKRANPPAKRPPSEEHQETVLHWQEIRHEWAGPLPPPNALAEFQRLVPDAPERIFRQWEEESAHRRGYEQQALAASIRRDLIGQCGAILFSTGALSVAGFALWLNQPWVAGIVGGTTIGSVVGAFLYQRAKGR